MYAPRLKAAARGRIHSAADSADSLTAIGSGGPTAPPRPWSMRYGVATAAVLLVLLLKPPIDAWVGPGWPPLVLFIPAVIFGAWYGGRGPGLVATCLGGLMCSYFFFAPTLSLHIDLAHEIFQLGIFLLQGTLVSVLMGELHRARRLAEEIAREAQRYRDLSRSSEQRLQAILDHSRAVISLKDEAGRYLLVNRRFEELFAPDGRPVIGMTDNDLFPADAAAIIRGHDVEALQAGAAREFEEVLPHPEGSRTYVSLRFPLADARRGVYAVGGVSTDITALKDAQRRAVQAERLAAIGQMVAGLAHESRNALQRGQAGLELLGLRLRDRPDTLEMLTAVQAAQDDLHRLYEEVRGYAAPIRLERRPCHLREILREAWDQLEIARRGRAARLHEAGEDDPICEGDPFRLFQVFRNVLDNALAAGVDPVEVEVQWSPAELDGRPAVRAAVRDNGPGLSAEQIPNLFEPFYTTKTQGTGLGLPIARRIVEAHGGHIEAAPINGRGATILITLPRGNP